MIRALYLTGPAAAAVAMVFVVSFFFDSFAGAVDAELLRLGPPLVILFPMLALMLFLRALMNETGFRDVAVGSALGVLVVIGWAAIAEYQRLAPFTARGYSWADLMPHVDAYALTAAIVALPFAIWFMRMGTGPPTQTRSGKTRAKRSRNATYGDADWMTESEAAELFPDGPGIVIGENYRPDEDYSAGPTFVPSDKSTWGQGGRHDKLCFNGQFGPTHGLVFAGSGGFKTTAVVVPTALNWSGSLVVLDPSKEVAPMVADARDAQDRIIHTLDPDRPELGFNVLDWIANSGNPEESVAATASWLMTEKPSVSSGSDDFFRNSALQLITGILGDIMLSGNTDPSKQNLRYLRKIIASPEPDLKKRLEGIYQESRNSFVRETVAPFIRMTDTTFSGVYANAAKETQWLSFERFGQLVSGNHFTSASLREGKTDVFINLDLKTLQTHPGFGRVIVGALLNSLYEADGEVKDRTLFLLDEAFLIGRMGILQTARDAGRKYGITLLMIYQSIGQLVDTWGPQAKPAWFESTSFRIFAAIADPKTAEELSAMCGEYTVEAVTRTKSSMFSKRATNTRNYSDQKRRLILAHEILQEMRSDEQLVFVQGRRPLRCGRAVYFRRPEMVEKLGANRFAKRAS
ncbi:type IV secretory system conjugative DNA transfer family protein [uncultured Roseobacter sp.]|uniref:type IV secretory system conjugative DNA transfer family protein n=1 Tax=uncultured Roseobacter sp. TaxID=114847 RepID=UPI0026091B86|nr:type IV secretory system conjugative DNA transfer family protein [uncultured Roseobacter sp.]